MIDSILKMGGAWHYRLDKLIARSTFGEVWQATWLQTGSQVAIKTINRSRMEAASPGLRPLWAESLRREIRLMDEIDHPHLVRKRRHGEVDGLPVLVLEQLHHSLADELKIRGPHLPSHEALEIVRQVADGLAWLHRHGICHLDLKPENLLFTPPGPCQRLKLADFGMSLKLVEDIGEHRIPGSLGWLAPEQVLPATFDNQGQPIYRSSPRTDVHALGLLLHYLLTGEKTAFAGGIEKRLRHDPQAIQHTTLEQLPPAGLSEIDQQHLITRLYGTGTAAQPAAETASSDTWLPALWPAPDNAAAQRAPPIEHRHRTAPDTSQLIALLQTLLAPNPDARPADAGVVLAKLVTMPR